jgi:transcriptional regulator with XRE-family HTH domain
MPSVSVRTPGHQPYRPSPPRDPSRIGTETKPGPTGESVRANIIEQRKRKNLTYARLSRKLKARGRAIPELRLPRIEDGDRRVDVDALMALAEALDVSPITLLVPETAKRNDLVEVTGRRPEPAETVWDWLRARHLRRGALVLNLRRPGPDVDEID